MKHDNRMTEVILDSIADGVFTIDAEGRITSFNRAAEQITGFKGSEAIGQFCFDIFRANICQNSCALKETLKNGKSIANLPVTILTIDGHERPISISTALLRDAGGEVIGGVETFRDLSAIEEQRPEAIPHFGPASLPVAAQHRLHPPEGLGIDNRRMLAVVALAPTGQLSEVEHVLQQREERHPVERG